MKNTSPIQSSPGFTLLEVMFSILILGTGLIAIASLFPVAGSIQRDTMDQVMAQSVTKSAEATLLTKGFPKALLENAAMPYAPIAANFQGGALSAGTVGNLDPAQDATLLNTAYPLKDRCYPQFYDPAGDGSPPDGASEDPNCYARQFYWRPLFKQIAPGNWQVFVFVQRRIKSSSPAVAADIPALVNTGIVNMGDMLLDPTGVASSANSEAATTNWHAEITGNRSSFAGFTAIGGGVVR